MVSAVILAYNRCSEVLITLEKLKGYASRSSLIFEIIVVDNASADNTGALVSYHHPDVILVTKSKNNGIAGWNDGFAVATQPFLLVLDDDSHPEGGIEEAISYMENDPKLGVLALNITSGPYQTDSWVWQNSRPWQHEQKILGFFGCGAIIRKTVYEKIGGFAEWMLVYAHEWEYGLRCMDAGYDIRYFQKSSIAHRASMVNRSAKRMMIYGSRNEMIMAYQFLDHRWKYLIRMWINNLKRIKSEGLAGGYYYLLGSLEFLRMRKLFAHTPVKLEVQQFFTENYMNTFPVFRFITKKFNKQPSR